MAILTKQERLNEIDRKKEIIKERIRISRERANRKLKSGEKLQTRLLGVVLITIFVVASILTFLGSSTASYSVNKSLNNILIPTVQLASDGLSSSIADIKDRAIDLGDNPIINSNNVSQEAKDKVFAEFQQETGALRSEGFSLEGYSANGKIATDEMITAIKNGEAYIDNPKYNAYGELVFQIAVPVTNSYALMEDPSTQTRIIGGILFDFDVKELTELLFTANVGDNGTAYMIDNNGVTIASTENYDSVLEQLVTINDPEADPRIVEAEKDMIQRNTSFVEYDDGGRDRSLAYAPVEGTNWAVAIDIVNKDFNGHLASSIFLSYVILVITLIISAIILVLFVRQVANPIIAISEAAKKMADGNFDVDLHVKAKGEIGVLADSFTLTLENTKETIKDITRVLQSMENKDFDIYTETKYVGDYEVIEKAIRSVRDNISDALGQIKVVGEQVASGSEQVASASQNLAQGATEQAASVEELSATIADISNQVETTNANAQIAAGKVNEAGINIEESNRHMTELMSAMDDITNKSNEISKIVKTIEDIAFQTNILALNAAVEAARAGAAGKGFAVVADEVRNLATKSSEAAKSTTNLIEQTTTAIAHGSKIASETAVALQTVVTTTEEVVEVVNQIAEASEAQASAIGQVTLGIEQISAVVQTNSATSEESAAASEELSGQARSLDELIQKFTLFEN